MLSVVRNTVPCGTYIFVECPQVGALGAASMFPFEVQYPLHRSRTQG